MVLTAHDAAYQTALDLHAAGAQIAAIADVRDAAEGPLPQAARAAGLMVHERMTVTATRGGLRVSEVSCARRDADGRVQAGTALRLRCDAVLMSGGYTPSVHLFSQARGRLLWDQTLQAFVPGEAFEHVRSAGACRGAGALADALSDGAAAAQAALRATGYSSPTTRSARSMRLIWAPAAGSARCRSCAATVMMPPWSIGRTTSRCAT